MNNIKTLSEQARRPPGHDSYAVIALVSKKVKWAASGNYNGDVTHAQHPHYMHHMKFRYPSWPATHPLLLAGYFFA